VSGLLSEVRQFRPRFLLVSTFAVEVFCLSLLWCGACGQGSAPFVVRLFLFVSCVSLPVWFASVMGVIQGIR
jgi:hypothetical protein